MRRASALFLTLWLSVSLAERAVLDHCPPHDPLGAAMAAAAHQTGMHGGADEHRSPGKPHQCSCLERCCGAAAMVLPHAAVRVPEAAVVHAVLPTPAPDAAAPARVDTRLPFANGFPPARAA